MRNIIPELTHILSHGSTADHIRNLTVPFIFLCVLFSDFIMMTATAEKIVFLAGDDEYRSEESLPMLAAILERDFGFETVMGYSIAEDGSIDPRVRTSLTGTEALADADLMVWFLRFRNPGDKAFQDILDYLDRGLPIVAFRTSTHAFKFPKQSPFVQWNWNRGEGDNNNIRQLLGQKWISHHGSFSEENPGHLTAVAPLAHSSHPIVHGVTPFRAYSWLYHVQGGEHSLAKETTVLVNGTALRSNLDKDPFPHTNPVAWIRTHGENDARVFTTTLGHPYDFREAGCRRLVLQGIPWALGREDLIPTGGVDPTPMKPWQPSPAGVRGKISSAQRDWYDHYKKQANAPNPHDQLFNEDPEPQLDGKDWVEIFNGRNLDGWEIRGGHCTFEVEGGEIVATTVARSPSTFLCTKRSDYHDFVFTAEVRWVVDSNTGVNFRSHVGPNERGMTTVVGPQAELEHEGKRRGWSGGIFGQGCGGFYYPVWLADERHVVARKAQRRGEWNRITIRCQGDEMRTWLNGTPVARLINEEHRKGFFALQCHAGKQGEVRFRHIRVHELGHL